MKRLRSNDDLHSYGEKAVSKDWGRRDEESSSQSQRSASSLHRSNSYYKPSDTGRKLLTSSTSRYDRPEDGKEGSRMIRRRSDYDSESYDRRKGYGADHLYRSESFSGPRRDFPKGFRSERDRPKREGIAASWRRFGAGKDSDDGGRSSADSGRVNRMEIGKGKSTKSPVWSKDSGSERSKSVDGKKCEDMAIESEREEGELDPDVPLATPVVENDAAVKELIVEASKSSIIKEDADVVASSDEQAEIRIPEDVEPVMENNVGDTMKVCDDTSSPVLEQRDVQCIEAQVKEDSVELTTKEAETELHSAIQVSNDKGKGIAASLSECAQFLQTNSRDIEREDGPSSVGFQFFSTDPIKKPETVEQLGNSKDDKLALDLSLSLPNVLLPIGAQNRGMAPGSPSQVRSVQSYGSSFRTFSDGFTASMSFSGSQHFTHNPSCSLTHTMQDNEQSVKSRPLFKGVDWKALSADENKNKDFQPYPKIPSKENDLNQQSQLSKADACLRVAGEGSKQQIRLDSQLSFSRHLSGGHQFFGSNDNRGKLVTEKDSVNFERTNCPDGKELVGNDFAESIVTMIVSEPITVMSQRFNEMSPENLASVKEFIHEIISNPVKQWQLNTLQKALLKRQDVSLDMLLNAHRIQLEILVALKTGLQEFMLKLCHIPSSELAEIFLNMRCRNLKCKSLLPVDECDCKICTQQSDFCRDCMCLVCSKFDNMTSTCSWVGCDVCLHWCHADCALKESLIRNGRSLTGDQSMTEVQFYCVACDHPSEMFGFVKEVFQNFAREWTAENLSRELEYVRKIFCGSEDVRGKRLHEFAVQMKSMTNRTYLRDIQNRIMRFFTEISLPDQPSNVAIQPTNKPAVNVQDTTHGNVGSGQGVGWLKSIDKTLNLENSVTSLPGFDRSNSNDNHSDIRKNPQKEQPAFDELESIIKVKLAEANMYQARADEARRESEALKRIAVSKSERMEEEYASRINKLRLSEAEDIRKQKVEELQGVERAYQEYFNMKMRMESDIKDLLLKMEAKRRNIAM